MKRIKDVNGIIFENSKNIIIFFLNKRAKIKIKINIKIQNLKKNILKYNFKLKMSKNFEPN